MTLTKKHDVNSYILLQNSHPVKPSVPVANLTPRLSRKETSKEIVTSIPGFPVPVLTPV